MNKLYLSYIPKVEGEQKYFKIIKSLEKCMMVYKGKNHIISSPGYLSTSKYVGDFVKEFVNIVPIGTEVYIGYLKGMNKIDKATGVCARIDEHYNELLKTGKFKKMKVKIKDKQDHRKMMFVYGIKDAPTFDFEVDELSITTKDKFLDSIIVNAILIGSSNQSYSTYYGGTIERATMGEADVLMFVKDDDKENFEDMYVDGTVIFEEKLGTNGKDPHDYLKDILNEFLSGSLG